MEVTKEIKQYQNLINGKLVSSSDERTMDAINPATGDVWARIPLSSKEDVESVVAAARRAFPAWTGLSAGERAEYLRKIGNIIDKYGQELAEMETMDTGWVIRESIYGLIPVLKQIWYDAAGAATVACKGETVPLGPTSFGYTIREPLGVVLGIIPWNAPLFTFTVKAAYALAAGNTVIIKPSELAAVGPLRYGEILAEILPPGVLNVISGLGNEIGDCLVAHKGINRVSLTGSGRTARSIIQSTARDPKPLTLELGGKSPNIVFEDADLEKAAEGVTTNGIFTGNAGQLCVAGSRILIQKSIFDEMLTLMKAKTLEPLKLGDTLDFTTTMGPIANLPQYEKVCSYLDLGVKEGGKIIFGGRRGGEILLPGQPQYSKGYWVEPTLIQVDKNSYRVCQEEIFGPVAVVIPFETEEEAIEIANDTAYGLGAGVWTTNLARAQRMISALESGTVWVNTYRRVGVELPFGGFKESGFGKDSILENTREKACVIEIG
ncbi:aldehyde dehydrogenase family protein [Neobacillus dielmonensis]|uniref:aldehyde dehydrogenase family protein n=1 Tax=Neobacillus dielmonensis TaxID=1347369 RepID=UPI000B19076B|nr:aldehyde dehydrogenase family protein [Neobacillus dielmonensis]